MSLKKSGFGCISLLGIAAVLFVGGRYISRQFLGRQLTPVSAGEVIPERAVLAGFVTTDSQPWSQIEKLGNARTQEILNTQLKDLETELFKDFEEFDYQQDIQPWLDGAMFALVPEKTTVSEPDLLMVLGIKNKLKARKFFKEIQQDSQVELQRSKYKGIEITESASADNTIVFALLGSRLLLSEDRSLIEQAIDSYKEKLSLASNFPNLLQEKLDTGNGLARIYIPSYNELISQASASGNNFNLPWQLSRLQPMESIAVGFGVEDAGLRLQSVIKFDPDRAEASFFPSKGKILNRFPDNTVALISGSGIDEFWTQVITLLKQDPELSKYFNFAQSSFRQSTNIDLEAELFNWMDGEFALGIVTTPESLIPELDVGLNAGIVLETSQPDAAKSTLTKLESSLQQYLAIAPSQNKINDKAVTQWQAYGVPGVLNYGWIDKNNLLFAGDKSTFESVSKSNKSPLAKSKKFQAMTQKLPGKNSGYLYVDMAQVMEIFKQLNTPESDPETESAIALFDSIQSVGSSVTMPSKNTTQQDLFILFKNE